MNILKSIPAAFAFLTIIPVKKNYNLEILGKACAFFPLVGLFIGTISGLFSLLHVFGISIYLIAAVTIVLPILLTGGLHFDGLLDSFDGLYGQREKTKRLEIMRDSSNGAIGVLSGIIVVLLKYSLILSLPPKMIFPAIVFACVFSRFTMTFCCCYIPYAKREGKGEVFTKYAKHKEFITASMITLCVLFFIYQTKALLIGCLSLLATAVFIIYVYSKIKGMTGDTMGACNELAEISTLTAIYISILL